MQHGLIFDLPWQSLSYVHLFELLRDWEYIGATFRGLGVGKFR